MGQDHFPAPPKGRTNRTHQAHPGTGDGWNIFVGASTLCPSRLNPAATSKINRVSVDLSCAEVVSPLGYSRSAGGIHHVGAVTGLGDSASMAIAACCAPIERAHRTQRPCASTRSALAPRGMSSLHIAAFCRSRGQHQGGGFAISCVKIVKFSKHGLEQHFQRQRRSRF